MWKQWIKQVKAIYSEPRIYVVDSDTILILSIIDNWYRRELYDIV